MKKAGMAKKSILLLSVLLGFCNGGCFSKEEKQAEESREIITLTMFVQNKSKYAGLQEDPVASYIENRFGIRIELTSNSLLSGDSEDNDTYKRILKDKLQINDLDDIMDFGPALEDEECLDMLQKAATHGLLYPLDKLIEQYAPELELDGRIAVRNEYRRENIFEDGNLYSLGSQGGVEDTILSDHAAWIRWDLYKQMGYPAVVDDEAFLDLLEQMQENYSEAPRGDKVFALGLAAADGEGEEIWKDYAMSKGYEPVDGSCAVYFNHANRTVASPLVDADSFFWSGVEFYFRANQRGLLDVDSLTMSEDDYGKKINKGTYLASFDGSEVKGKDQILAGKGMKDAGYMPLASFEDVQTVLRYQEDVLGNREIVITADCKHPERAMEFLEWCFSLEGSRILTQGTQGLVWTNRDGIYEFSEDFRKDATLGIVDLAEKYGRDKYSDLAGFLPLSKDAGGDPIRVEDNMDVYELSAVEEDALNYYGEDYLTETAGTGDDIPQIAWQSCLKRLDDAPQDIVRMSEEINEYMKQAIFECVFAEDEAEFQAKKEAAIQQAELLGVNEVSAWYVKELDETQQTLGDLVDRAMALY